MKVTVCELNNSVDGIKNDWGLLVDHVISESSELVLLPEMPFYPWVARTNRADPGIWEESVSVHDKWMARFPDLGTCTVVGSRPIIQNGKRLNEGFVWDPRSGYRPVHHKYYLPNENNFWEASWYQRGNKKFEPLTTNKGKVGFLICTEIWFNSHARTYAKQGIDFLVCPRATPKASVDKWISGGRTAAVVSGAYCLSSNLNRSTHKGLKFGGTGWIIEPEEGDVLGLTSEEYPFLTMDIDLSVAQRAKQTYPRYVSD